MRQRREWKEHGRDHCGDYPEPAIVINTTRRWIGNQRRGEGNKRTRRTRKHPRKTGRSRARKIEGGKDMKRARTEADKEGRQKSMKDRAERTANEDDGKPKIASRNNRTKPLKTMPFHNMRWRVINFGFVPCSVAQYAPRKTNTKNTPPKHATKNPSEIAEMGKGERTERPPWRGKKRNPCPFRIRNPERQPN